MDDDPAAPPAPARPRHVHGCLLRREQTPQLGRAAVAQHPVRGQGRCQPARHATEWSAADGVDAEVDPMQPAVGDETVEATASHPRGEDLLTGDEPALARSDSSDGSNRASSPHTGD